MNAKVLLGFVVVLILVSFATESEAFTAGRGKNRKKIQSKREYEVSFKNNYLFFLGVSLKVFLNRGSY